MVLRSQVEPAPVDVGLVASEAQHSLRGRADPGHPQATRVAPGGPLHRLLRGVHAVLRGHVHVQLHAVRVPVGGYHAVVEVVHGPSEEREVVLKGGGQKLHRQLHARASEPEGRQARRHARRRQQAQRRAWPSQPPRKRYVVPSTLAKPAICLGRPSQCRTVSFVGESPKSHVCMYGSLVNSGMAGGLNQSSRDLRWAPTGEHRRTAIAPSRGSASASDLRQARCKRRHDVCGMAPHAFHRRGNPWCRSPS